MSQEPPREDYQAPPHQLAIWSVLGAAFVLVLGLFSIRTAQGPTSSREYASRVLPPEPPPVLIVSEGPSEEYWPCSDCHEDEPTNATVRELEDEHDELEFGHGNLWCLSCHKPPDHDRLRLADGGQVEYSDSWQLCTQCHGKKLTEWRTGVHGKRTGYWWGPKEFQTCVTCHDPHVPRFKPLEPLAPPRPPTEISLTARAREVPHERP
jgi:hypothetical protein